MINIYRPVFKNIEREFISLTENIHIDDSQLSVYSSKISDLILRSASEIESIAKELYLQNWWSKKDPKDIYFDNDAIKLLNSKRSLDKKIVILSHYNCFLNNNVFRPFNKIEKWNKPYQWLKHNRWNNIQKWNIKVLINILSALYILNIYYQDIIFELWNDYQLINFDKSIWSSIFEIQIHNCALIYTTYFKADNFDNSIYLSVLNQESYDKAANLLNDVAFKINSTEINQKNLQKIIDEYIINTLKKNNIFINSNYKAVLNKNQF